MARSYAKLDGPLNFDTYMKQIQKGRSYVSDGASHIIDFTINGFELGTGTQSSELKISRPDIVNIKAKVAAYLPIEQSVLGKVIASQSLDQPPYWHIERARSGKSQKVPIELIVNGEPVEKKMVKADGQWVSLNFTYPIEKSSWLALRIYPSSHSNPIFVLVNNKPIRASKRSAEWCRKSVVRCWKMKSVRIRPPELESARIAYDKARLVYDQIIKESQSP